MLTNKDNIAAGDAMSPALLPDINALTRTEDSEEKVPAVFCPLHTPSDGILSFSYAAKYRTEETIQGTCSQTLWVSFFFDGTGNNMDADIETEKHSNIVKLYQAHAEDDFVTGFYRVYIPGIGTYFKDVKDKGGSLLGLGSGAGGDARIKWALEQLEKKIQKHIARSENPSNPITLINVSAFGFSRGAALARAFATRLMLNWCIKDGEAYKLKTGQFPIRFRFMGLFDTVASSGVPMSFNNISVFSATGGARALINSRIATKSAPGGPNSLAFDLGAKAGADPSPGPADGHEGYGGELQIPDIVEKVQHFIAAHEIRNSFPVDSIAFRENDGSLRVIDNERFTETVYPGVHSDVGGSYRPGEGGRDLNPASKLGLIPLKHMYDLAISSGVPLLPEMSWGQINKSDFEISEDAANTYNYYCEFLKRNNNDCKIKLDLDCLGGLFNAHMSLYYAWRFQSIRKKTEGKDKIVSSIEKNEETYRVEKSILERKISKLRKEINDAARASSNPPKLRKLCAFR